MREPLLVEVHSSRNPLPFLKCANGTLLPQFHPANNVSTTSRGRAFGTDESLRASRIAVPVAIILRTVQFTFSDTLAAGRKSASTSAISLVLYEIGTTAERPTHAAKNQKRIYTRAPPKRAERAFALLTKTYCGSRVTGRLPYQDSTCPISVNRATAARTSPLPV